jgi:tetratricopeptide (TPR) repeat protein
VPASRNSRPEARDETARRGRRHRLLAALFGTALCLTGPAAAAEEPVALGAAQGPAAGSQSTGSIHGRVTTGDGRPVAGATVTLVSLEAQESGIETVTDMNGRFSEVDLAPGQYSVSAGKTDLGDQIFRVLVHPAGSVDVRFVLEAGRTAAPWLRALRDDETAAAAFAAGVRANRDGNYDDAIVQFETVLQVTPACVDCHFNIGVSHSRLNRYADAEAAYRRAIAIRSDYAPAHYGLADIFNRQNRPEAAAAARGEANRIAVRRLAAGRAGARETLTRGIAVWDSGNVGDALRLFREAAETDPTLADAHYWLGLAYEANGDPAGARRSFARYLGAAPNGAHAGVARRRAAALRR